MWFLKITLLTLSAINKCHSRQVDFILAYLQAPIEYDMFMELPKGFKTKEVDGRNHYLQLLKNLYGQKQAGHIWNHHLNNALKSIGFKQPAVDQCVWYREKNILFYYVNGGIFIGPDSKAIDKSIE